MPNCNSCGFALFVKYRHQWSLITIRFYKYNEAWLTRLSEGGSGKEWRTQANL